MTNVFRGALTFFGLALFTLLFVPACSTSPSSVATNGKPGCPANAKECVSPQLARVCPGDGRGWLTLSCAQGTACDQGDCKADPNVACIAGSAACMDGTTALRCRATGMGYDVTPCPGGTTCGGAGLCAGACVVGSSKCVLPGVLATCADGQTYTATMCDAGLLCVATGTSPAPTAACKPAECTPAGGCSAECGNRTDPAADQTKFYSTCTPTPDGYKWSAVSCGATQSCSPNAGVCPQGPGYVPPSQAGCASACTPGQTRCSSDKRGTQICGADGKWASVTACNASATSAALLCMPKPGDPLHAICGDPICAAGNAGTCDAAGFRACGSDGRLAGAGAACTIGSCIPILGATPIAGLLPGSCRPDCQVGDERCAANGSASFVSCTANGRYTTIGTCPAADAGAGCLNYVTPLGRPGKVCGGVCGPGTTRCLTGDAGVTNDTIQICNATGNWDPPVTCAVGLCTVGAVPNAQAACVAECVPNAPVCVGGAKGTVPPYSGTDSYGICSPNGRMPLPASYVACAGTTTCRKGANGQAIAVAGGNACIECVGTGVPGGNEDGLVDTRCSDLAGTVPSTVATQLCGAANTFVDAPIACGSGQTCFNAVHPSGGPVMDTCETRNSSGQVHAFTESYYATRPGGPFKCNGAKRSRVTDYGDPIQCGVTPDCCGTRCQRARTPASPATCR